MDEKYLQMTTGPVERLVCRLAVPTITIMMITAMYNMADTYFVGSLGTAATAAVGVVFPLMALLQAVGFFFGHGCGNYVSRALGSQQTDDAVRMTTSGFILTIIAGCILCGLGLVFLRPLATLLGATPTVLPYTCDYLSYILLGAPFYTASLTLNNILRFQGNAFYGMIGMTAGALLNVILDPVLIFVFHMGVSGAAIATSVSQAASFCLLLYGLNRHGSVRIKLRAFSLGWDIFREIIRGGSPSLFRQGFNSISFICLNTVAGGYGDAAIAAISIVQRVTSMAFSATMGLGQGFQPVCGFNYGAGLYSRVKKAYWFCIKLSTIALAILAAAAFIFAPGIVMLFRKDDRAVIDIGSALLRLQCAALPLMGYVTISSMLMQTIGQSLRASLLSMSRQGMFLLPLLYLLSYLMGLRGLQLSQPISDISTFLLAIPLTAGVLRGLREDKQNSGV